MEDLDSTAKQMGEESNPSTSHFIGEGHEMEKGHEMLTLFTIQRSP